MKKNIIAVIVLFASVSGCNYAQMSGVGGAGAGALIGQAIGKNTEATLIGAAVGTMVGYMIGNEMDKYDKAQLNNAFETGQSGRVYAWDNPDNGNNFEVIPGKAQRNPKTGQICRPAKIEGVIDGRREDIIMKSCRDKYGQWHQV
ncbi:MAG: glycine zipper domain-containing protein [Patescibacteria group bacterium]